MSENKEETYTMRYKCSNCRTEFTNRVPKGKRAYGRGGKCPSCGIPDSEQRGQGRFTSTARHDVLGLYEPRGGM